MRKKHKKTLHVIPFNDQWALMEEGNKAPIQIHESRELAVIYGSNQALNEQTEVAIHNDDGTVHNRESYRYHRSHRRCKAKCKSPKNHCKGQHVMNWIDLAHSMNMTCKQYLAMFY